MNIKNIKNLLHAYFLKNNRKDIIVFCIVTLVTLLINLLSSKGDTAVEIIIVVFLLFAYTSHIFNDLSDSSKSIHYLMIPANHYEKVVTNIILVNIYYVLLLAFGVWIGYSIAYVIHDQMFLSFFSSSGEYMARYRNNINGGNIILAIYTITSIFFFGSVYFKKRSFGKIILWSLLIGLVFSLILIFVIWLNLKSIGANSINNYLPLTKNDPAFFNEGFFKSISYLCQCIGIVYFYILSFFRLKETEA